MQNGEVTARYQYDSIDNMVFAETKQGRAEYQYNGFGKKTGIKVEMAGYEGDGQAGRTGYILDYTKDYNNLLQRKTEGRTETYFWDNSLLSASHTKEDDLLHQEAPAINMTYLLDPLGSPLHFCNAEGGIEESYGYDAFGEDLYTQEDNTAVESIDRMQPFGFTGYERDDISGLYYAQARRYVAQTGRFTSRDMIKGYISGLQSQNEYAYCLGNPLLYVDRDGKKATPVRGASSNTRYTNNYVEIPEEKMDEDMNSGATGGYVSGAAGIINGSIKFKYAYDDKGNTVPQVEFGVGTGLGEGISFGAVQVVSSADSVDEMDGFSYGVGAKFEVGGGVGVDISTGQNDKGYLDVTNVEVYTGAGEEINAYAYISWTANLNIFRKNENEGSKENKE